MTSEEQKFYDLGYQAAIDRFLKGVVVSRIPDEWILKVLDAGFGMTGEEARNVLDYARKEELISKGKLVEEPNCVEPE